MNNINEIVYQFSEQLEKRGYDYTEEAVRSIVEKSVEAKSKLIEMFRTHPNWDEDQLCIHFDKDIQRKYEHRAKARFAAWIRNNVPLSNALMFVDENLWYRREYSVDHVINELPNMQILPEETEWDWSWLKEKVNACDEKWHFRPGMKLSRVVNKICAKYGIDKVPGYDKAFAEFADGVNPHKVARHTTISVNPLDFLLMSNGNSWTSCHYIGDDDSDAGCHSSGTISYMLDETSFIISVIDKDYEGIMALAPKENRQVCAYSDHQLLQSRLYPQACDGGCEETYNNLRAMMEEIIANSLGEANRWVQADKNIYLDGTPYPDWEYNKLTKMWVLRKYMDEKLEPIRVGKRPLCVKCGEEHRNPKDIVCDSCKPITCYDCGCVINLSDDSSYVESGGYYYCTHCRKYCEKCGCVEPVEDLYHIEDLDEDWCNYCRRNYAFFCRDCERYYSEDFESTEACICKDCYEVNFFECPECGDSYRFEDGTMKNGELYCKSCARDIEEEEAV